MKPTGFAKIYDLHTDTAHIKNVQTATLHTKEYGLKPEHGLFGSEEWWSVIEHGRIRRLVLEGVISRVYMSGHNDFPEFEVISDEGKTTWQRLGDDRWYVVGRKIRMVYIKQQFKAPLKIRGGKPLIESDVILEIWVEK